MSEATRKCARGTGLESLVWILARDDIHTDNGKRSGKAKVPPLTELKFYTKG